MDNCCRLCCQQEGEMHNIFESCEGLPIAVLIMIICPVKIQKNDNLSKLVCIECLEVVTSAYQLRELSNNNDRKFRSLPSDNALEENDNASEENDNASEENDNASEENDDAFEEYDDNRPLLELKIEHVETTKTIAQKTAMTKIEDSQTTTKIPNKNLAINKPRTSHAHFKVGKRRLKKYQQLKKTMACLWCNKKYSSIFYLKVHVSTYHINFDKMFNLERTVMPKHYKCDLCGESFYYKSGVENHLLVEHLTRRNVFPHPIECDDTFCFRRFENYENMITHQLRTHRKPGIRILQCSDCTEGFKNYTSLFSHKLAYHQELLKIHADSMPEFSKKGRNIREKLRTTFYKTELNT